MANITQANITIDLLFQTCQRIYGKQFDSLSRAVVVRLCAGGTAFDTDENTSFFVKYSKPDGTRGLYNKLPDGQTDAVSVDSNNRSILNVLLAPQIFTVPGDVTVSIAMVVGGNNLQTFSFVVSVEPSEVTGEESINYFNYPAGISARNVEFLPAGGFEHSISTVEQALEELMLRLVEVELRMQRFEEDFL